MPSRRPRAPRPAHMRRLRARPRSPCARQPVGTPRTAHRPHAWLGLASFVKHGPEVRSTSFRLWADIGPKSPSHGPNLVKFRRLGRPTCGNRLEDSLGIRLGLRPPHASSPPRRTQVIVRWQTVAHRRCGAAASPAARLLRGRRRPSSARASWRWASVRGGAEDNPRGLAASSPARAHKRTWGRERRHSHGHCANH